MISYHPTHLWSLYYLNIRKQIEFPEFLIIIDFLKRSLTDISIVKTLRAAFGNASSKVDHFDLWKRSKSSAEEIAMSPFSNSPESSVHGSVHEYELEDISDRYLTNERDGQGTEM